MTQAQEKHDFKVGHITFRTINCPKYGFTFALLAGDVEIRNPKPLFSGHVSHGMGSELRRLAHHFDDIGRGKA